MCFGMVHGLLSSWIDAHRRALTRPSLSPPPHTKKKLPSPSSCTWTPTWAPSSPRTAPPRTPCSSPLSFARRAWCSRPSCRATPCSLRPARLPLRGPSTCPPCWPSSSRPPSWAMPLTMRRDPSWAPAHWKGGWSRGRPSPRRKPSTRGTAGAQSSSRALSPSSAPSRPSWRAWAPCRTSSFARTMRAGRCCGGRGSPWRGRCLGAFRGLSFFFLSFSMGFIGGGGGGGWWVGGALARATEPL